MLYYIDTGCKDIFIKKEMDLREKRGIDSSDAPHDNSLDPENPDHMH
jgi:hypothetical protein